MLGQVDGLEGWHSIDQHPDAHRADGIVVYRWEAALFFANAGEFRRQLRRPRPSTATRRGSCCSARPSPTSTSPPPRCSSRLDLELNSQGIHLAFVELRGRLRPLLLDYGLLDVLDRQHFYPTLDAALAAIDTTGSASP